MSGRLVDDATVQAWLAGIAEAHADLCEHEHYVYWDDTQGAWVHEDDGASCDEGQT